MKITYIDSTGQPEDTSIFDPGKVMFYCRTNMDRIPLVSCTLSECFWTGIDKFRKTCVSIIVRTLSHVNSPARFVCEFYSMGNEKIRTEMDYDYREVTNFLGYTLEARESVALSIVSKIMLGLLDRISLMLKPTTYTIPVDAITSDVGSDYQSKQIFASDSGPSKVEKSIDEIKADIDLMKEKIYTETAIPIDRIEPKKEDNSKEQNTKTDEMFGTTSGSWHN